MTLKTWAKRCGWPYEELLETPVDIMFPIWDLMDLRLVFVPIRRPRAKT